MKKKLPIGIQTFAKIRDNDENYVYIDKTLIAYNLITSGTYYFLSRPRRFGKSLFLDTLSEIFKGGKHLFEGLAIYPKWNWEQQYPVINISFAAGTFSSKTEITDTIKLILNENCEKYQVEVPINYQSILGKYFEKLIHELYKKFKQKVVILIDEYDKPILDNIHLDDKTPASDARAILRDMYSAIKPSDAYIKFVFITGVSKFSKLNLFSGLNNLNDITIDPSYATITGYTHADVEQHFANYLTNVNLNQVKRWYNGYNYFGEPIYNPFDILLFISKGCDFANYWWQTGNPSFLIEILKKRNFYLPNLENIEVTEETLNAFDVEAIDLVALLWQTGYLTFNSKSKFSGRNIYTLKVPNLEIQNSLNELFLGYLTQLNHDTTKYQISIAKAIINKQFDNIKQALFSLFAAIPFSNFNNNTISIYEGYYASVVFAFLASIGFDIIPEDITNHGRIDMTLKADDALFIFEFKVDMPTETAMQQIKSKRYYEKYINLGKPIYLIGIHFNSSLRNIEHFEWEEAELMRS